MIQDIVASVSFSTSLLMASMPVKGGIKKSAAYKLKLFSMTCILSALKHYVIENRWETSINLLSKFGKISGV